MSQRLAALEALAKAHQVWEAFESDLSLIHTGSREGWAFSLEERSFKEWKEIEIKEWSQEEISFWC